MSRDAASPVVFAAGESAGARSLQGLLRLRADVLATTRAWFADRGFIEVETPTLYPGRDATPVLDDFTTVYRGVGSTDVAGEIPLSLPTSPEFYMKRLLGLLAREDDAAGPVPPLFQVCKFYRNGEATSRHNPEYTGLEFYIPGGSLDRMLALVEGWLRALAPHAASDALATRLAPATPYPRVRWFDAFTAATGLDLSDCEDDLLADRPDAARDRLNALLDQPRWANAPARSRRPKNYSYVEAVEWLFVSEVEPTLGRDVPTFVTHFPARDAAFARVDPADPRVALRAELFAFGLELGNGFDELVDVTEQRQRLEEAAQTKTARTGEPHPVDERFLDALASMPPSAGMAMGLDRVVMLLCGADSIADVLPFPFVEEVR
jgi:lysyl-tRNA synthetase class 2